MYNKKQELSLTGMSGVEEDEISPEIEPFNPNDISIRTNLMPMAQVVRRLQTKRINLAPDFQRNEVWDIVKKSQLIESLMLNIPLPMFYVSANENDDFAVVDGLQRLSTIRDYIANKESFSLKGLEFWPQYEGKKFIELPMGLQDSILETNLSFTIIEAGTPEKVKRTIFKRINTGGMPLSQQEIRHALYQGLSTELLKYLVNTNEFLDATGHKIDDSRMVGREIILRFISFLLRNYSEYKKNDMDSFLSDTMIIINNFNNLNSKEMKKKFEKTPYILYNNDEDIKKLFKLAMERSKLLFGNHAFRKSLPTEYRTPINKTIFELWSVTLSQISETDFKMILENKISFFESYKIIRDTSEFQRAVSRDSWKFESVKFRYERINYLINNLL